MDFVRASFLLLLLAVIGCSGEPAPVSVQPPSAPTGSDAAKAVLQGVVDSGELGSGADELRTILEGMKGSDAAKAEELLKGLADLEKAANPEEAKSKAQAMLGKL